MVYSPNYSPITLPSDRFPKPHQDIEPFMNRKNFVFLIVLVGLSGCLGWQQFSEGLQAYQGGDVDQMVTRFGAPDRSVDLPGDPIRVAYTWQIHNQGGEHVCNVTAIADKQSGKVASVSDNCGTVR
jgi:hypothetical protein